MDKIRYPEPVACTITGFWPFGHVTITRVRDADGEPTEWVEVVGSRQGGERSVRVLYARLFEIMDSQMGPFHGKSRDDPHTSESLEHATLRAAVACLMDRLTTGGYNCHPTSGVRVVGGELAPPMGRETHALTAGASPSNGCSVVAQRSPIVVGVRQLSARRRRSR